MKKKFQSKKKEKEENIYFCNILQFIKKIQAWVKKEEEERGLNYILSQRS